MIENGQGSFGRELRLQQLEGDGVRIDATMPETQNIWSTDKCGEDVIPGWLGHNRQYDAMVQNEGMVLTVSNPGVS